MSRPLKINNTTDPFSLREMSDSDIAYITYRVLYEFANTQSGTGTLNTTGTGTQIGAFSDTSRPYNVGDHPVGTEINTNTIVFYQDRSVVTPNPSARPVFWNGSAVKGMTDSDLNNTVISNAALSLVNNGIGSYQISTTVPSGGTWTQIFNFNDTSAGGNTQYSLYRKINDSQPPVERPLKTVSGGLREMTDAEINTLVDNLREYIRTTGIGYYELQSSAPTDGTYTNTGQIIDLRNQVQDQTYTGEGYFRGETDIQRIGEFYSGFVGPIPEVTGEVFYSGFQGPARPLQPYTGEREFTGTNDFTGLTVVSSQDTISTVNLWVRQS